VGVFPPFDAWKGGGIQLVEKTLTDRAHRGGKIFRKIGAQEEGKVFVKKRGSRYGGKGTNHSVKKVRGNNGGMKAIPERPIQWPERGHVCL